MIEQAQQDAPGEAAASWVNPQHGAGSFTVGCKVYLRACAFGQPGRVLRIEQGKLAVLWADLGPSYIGRHRPDSLMLAGDSVVTGNTTEPVINTGLPATLAALLEQVDEEGL